MKRITQEYIDAKALEWVDKGYTLSLRTAMLNQLRIRMELEQVEDELTEVVA